MKAYLNDNKNNRSYTVVGDRIGNRTWIRFYKRNNNRSIGNMYDFGSFSCFSNGVRSLERAIREGTLYEEAYEQRSTW